MKDKITIKLPVSQPNLFDELKLMAEGEGKKLNRFLVEHILALRGCGIDCEDCGWPILNESKLPANVVDMTLQCPKCGHQQRHEIEE
ncbi:MAG: hypothetical protein ACFFCW_41445 [Candidatus Hodarchaeota archaeon]